MLGCKDTNVTKEELKRCYYEKGRKYHPDTLEGKDLPDEIIQLAKEKFQEIQEAYERLSGS